jgi:hypothetical protein
MVNDVDGPATDQRHVAVITIFSGVTLTVKNDRYRLVAKLQAQKKKPVNLSLICDNMALKYHM